MKVRMIFAHEYTPKGATEPRTLKVDEEHDIPDALAGQLIREGRAESLEPAKKDAK